MKVELKSNGSQHTIPNKVWDDAPESFKRNYTVISKTEEVTTKQVVENTVNTGKASKKKDEEKPSVESTDTSKEA